MTVYGVLLFILCGMHVYGGDEVLLERDLDSQACSAESHYKTIFLKLIEN